MRVTPPHTIGHNTFRRHTFCIILLLGNWLLIACSVDAAPAVASRRATLRPTFTATNGSTPTADAGNPGITKTPAPLFVADAKAPETGAGATAVLLPTSAPTGTALLPAATVVSPTLSIAPIPTIPAAMLTPTASPVVTPTAAPPHTSAPTLYLVQTGDTLSRIAQQYQTTVAAIMMANGLTDDLIHPSQSLLIPDEAPPLTVVPAVVPAVAAPASPLVVLEGDLATTYPLSIATDRFTLHYTANPPPPYPPEELAAILARALQHHEAMLQIHLDGRFDAYASGAPFAPPDQSLRGHSYSADRFFVFLADGSGNPDDLTYLMAHELTHMLVWLVFGRPTDPMLSEGAAVYVGMAFIDHAQHLPITTFCAAYDQVGALPWVSARLTYKGHIRDLANYYAAGCFVKYLIERYGVEPFGRLYPSNDYVGIYGKTLAQLDAEWHASVTAAALPVPVDAALLVQSVERLAIAHAALFNTFTGTPEQMAKYRALDQIRMALLEGRLDAVQRFFSQ